MASLLSERAVDVYVCIYESSISKDEDYNPGLTVLYKATSMIEMQGVWQDSDSILDFLVTLWNVAIIIA